MWFQAIKGVSAIESGVMSLPIVISFVVFSFLGGSLTTVTGYYTQFVYLTVIFTSIGAGLLSTLQINSDHAEWIGYQVIFGAGVGLGLQSAFTATQTALELADVPIGTAIVMFTENLGAAIMISVAENVFTNQLTKNLERYVPSIDPQTVINGGATQLRNEAMPEDYNAVLNAYNMSLMQTFYVAVALSCFSVLGAVWVQWLSVKGKKTPASSA
jgi:hypothetical protein